MRLRAVHVRQQPAHLYLPTMSRSVSLICVSMGGVAVPQLGHASGGAEITVVFGLRRVCGVMVRARWRR